MAALDGEPNARSGGEEICYFPENFDEPPFSRLFLRIPKLIPKYELLERFAPFGEIQDFWTMRSPSTPDLVSSAFIKYARSSQACLAAESVGDKQDPGTIQGFLAQSRTSTQIGIKQLTRICVNVPKSFTVEKLRATFKVYGDIKSCIIQRTEVLNGDKDLAYIKFSKASQAALAIEECGNSSGYNAVWADVLDILTKPSRYNSCVNGPKQKTTTHEVQGSSVITLNSKTQPVMKPFGSSVYTSYVSSTNQETQSHRIQESNLITLGSRITLAESVTKPPESSMQKTYVGSANQKTSNHGVQARNLITLGSKTALTEPVTKLPESCKQTYHVGSEKQVTQCHRVQGSNLILLGKPPRSRKQKSYVGSPDCRTPLTQPVMKPSESSVHNSFAGSGKQETDSHRVQGSNLITLGYTTSLAEPVSKPSESREQEYYVGGSSYRSALTQPVTKPHESSVHNSFVGSGKQETYSHSIQGSNLIMLASDKFQEPSERGVCTLGTCKETNSYEEQRSDLLQLDGSPDLAGLERRDNRRQESVSRRLSVVSEFPFLQEQLFNLFDLIPGLESCETHQGPYRNRAYAVIQYSSAASAIYAKDRLHGFEYPFGNRLLIRFIEDGTDGTDHVRQMATQLVTSQLSSTIWNNNWADQFLGSSSSNSPPQLQTDAELPSSKRKAPSDSSMRERLLIMFNPHPLSEDILDDVLSRFGNFINIYLIPGENLGYATFADRASASDAIAVLHGKTVNGVKLKVMLADLPTENSNKRQRTF